MNDNECLLNVCSRDGYYFKPSVICSDTQLVKIEITLARTVCIYTILLIGRLK